MIFFRFGWAKPVPINMRYFKNPRRGMAISAAAGPISNFLLAFISALIYVILHVAITGRGIGYVGIYSFVPGAPTAINLQIALLRLVATFHILNLSLALFNLIPINPLDGSRILHIFLPAKAYYWLMNHERYIMFGMLLLLWTGILSTPLAYAVTWLSEGMIKLINLIPFLG
jgi:Zn-dependent protease